MWPGPALAAEGWYLISPPVFPASATKEARIGEDLPLGQWYRHGAFDSAKACEVAREKFAADATRVPLEASITIEARTTRAIALGRSQARCIAAGDVQLRRFP